MECPLCEHTGLDANTDICPSCKADLTAYHSLDVIETSYKKQKNTSLLLLLLFIVALIACAAIFFLNRGDGVSTEAEEKMAACETMVQELNTKNQALQQQISDLKAENAQLQEVKEEEPAAEPEPTTHIIKEGESLFAIAQQYLGDGKLYPQIAKSNGIDDPNMIIAGTEIIIKK